MQYVLLLLLLGLTFASCDPIFIKASDGDNVKCVEITKQPAFDSDNNGLLKNHKIQKWPSEIPRNIAINKKSKWQTQEAQVSTAKCPDGTIPLRQDEPISSTSSDTNPPHEYATGSTKGTPLKAYGTKAKINMWNPTVEDNETELSISQIWISSGGYSTNDLNTIEVGWQVFPGLYNDNKPRLFIFWTSDTYNTGCYNLRCSGFIQTSNKIVLGGTISPISTFGDNQFEITILVWKDQKYGNWWLSLGPNNSLVGYWPAEIFTTLADHATWVDWGGEIVNSQRLGRHTTTQMGSGHFPDEGFGKASYFRNLEIVDNNNTLEPFQKLKMHAEDDGKFYNIRKMYNDEWGTHFFYGGPGFSRMHSGVVPLTLSLFFICFCFSFSIII